MIDCTAFDVGAAIDSHREQLEVVLTAAAKTVGNRQRFLDAGLVDSALRLAADWQAAFMRLLPLEKATLRQQPGDFLADADDVVYRGRTSGSSESSGASFTYFAGQRWNQQRIAGRSQQMGWWGLAPDVPMLNLASRLSPVREQDISLIGAIDADFLEKLQLAVRQGPVVLRGYPSRLCEVAAAVHYAQALWDFGNVVAVIATGECLFDYQRSLLERTFKAPVINEYGCPEAGISGITCPEAGRLHLDGDRCLYEIVDGNLLVTDLYNTTMPMVRYCNGDRLQIDSTACSCGRLGLTARVLGREEEAIKINDDEINDETNGKASLCWPGEIALPSFPGILSYQLQLSAQKQQLWVLPEAAHCPPDLTPIKSWLDKTFRLGDGEKDENKETTVVLESPLDFRLSKPEGVSALAASDGAAWVRQVLHSSWTSWLSQPLPMGEAEAIARLLKQLAAPRYVVTQGLPAHTQAQVQSLLKSCYAQDFRVEALKIRTLLWAASLLSNQIAETEKIYLALLDRSQRWVDTLSEGDHQESGALAIDLLAPLLVLPTATAQSRWLQVQTFIQQTWTNNIQADRFTLHHYLSLLAIAGQQAQKPAHPWMPALRPLSAILIGDFQMLARLGPKAVNLPQIATWADVVHGLPNAFTKLSRDLSASLGKKPLSFFDDKSSFQATWRAGRQHLLEADYAAFEQVLAQLFDLAETLQQVAQCWLEKGYGSLLLGETLAPSRWIDVLKTQIEVSSSVPLLSQPANQSANRSANQRIAHNTDPLPWLPILKKLAPQLIAANQPRLAYACLFAAAPPSRINPLFDRYCLQVNNKQSIVSSRTGDRLSCHPGEASNG